MKLTLDHTQRLNLHALLGAQRADVGSIRAIWAIQDKLALTSEEEKAIELKREFVAGRERTIWNPALPLQTKGFDFTETEVARIRAAVETWDGYSVAADRRWLEPLLGSLQLPGTRAPTPASRPHEDTTGLGDSECASLVAI